MWPLVNDRFNFFTPTKKPTGWGEDHNGRRRRIYDNPKTPLDRLLAAGVMSPTQQQKLIDYRNTLNPARLAREIDDCQCLLIKLAAAKTDQPRTATTPAAPTPTAASNSAKPAETPRALLHEAHRNHFAGSLT